MSCLVEQLARVLRMSVHVEVVGSLGSADLVKRLADVMLRFGKMNVTGGIDILRRRILCDDDASSEQS